MQALLGEKQDKSDIELQTMSSHLTDNELCSLEN